MRAGRPTKRREDRERTLVENALNESIARALSEQKSVAWWDDPIIKITDNGSILNSPTPTSAFFLTETYSHDEVYILNAEDRPLYGFANGEELDPATSKSACRTQARDRRDSQGKTHELNRAPTRSTSCRANYGS